jgi:hypothetical protein
VCVCARAFVSVCACFYMVGWRLKLQKKGRTFEIVMFFQMQAYLPCFTGIGPTYDM